MQPLSFTAASAEEAVAQIRGRLGPEAVVLNVRPLPRNGLARLWQKPLIEVIAYLPEAEPAPVAPAASDAAPITEALAEFRQQLQHIRQQVESGSTKSESASEFSEPQFPVIPSFTETVDLQNGKWRIGAALQRSGMLPLHAQRVVDELRVEHGEIPPASLAAEISLARAVLAKLWRKSAPVEAHSRHILMGPAGSGKTTCLCKWLTQAVLMEGRLARVWRLDGATANMAESLTIYSDILGAPCERNWLSAEGTADTANAQPNSPGVPALAEDIGFIDLPGVDWRNSLAVKELAKQLKQFGSPRVHLVLNGAYDASILLAQARAFAELPVEDLILTHLDEETRWGKIWNLALGTNYSIRHLSTGQNIPGDYCEASAETVLTRQFPCK